MCAQRRKNGLLFKQVCDDLLRRICGGEFPDGSQMPTEPELIRHYGVSITTIRKAMQVLADKGVVSKHQGMGTFVEAVPTQNESSASVNIVKTLRTPFKIGVFLPNTMKLKAEGDSRHWTLNVRRLNGIYFKASELNTAVMVHGFHENVDLNSYDGIISMPSYAVELDSEDQRALFIRKVENMNIPHVTISEFEPRFSSKYWIAELIELEFYKAVTYLIAKNMRSIALIGPNLRWGNPRYAGYRKALDSGSISFNEELIVENPLSDSLSGKDACAMLFKRFSSNENALRNLDAIFCTTDLQAYGVLSFLEQEKIEVPKSVCVMGVDNLPDSEHLRTPLSSMEFSGPSVGSRALELLMEVIEGKYPDGLVLSVPGKIMERLSTEREK